jgi:hypothetical protein
MSEFAEDLNLPALPDTVEAYFAQERSWWRLLRGVGAVTETETLAELRRSLT